MIILERIADGVTLQSWPRAPSLFVCPIGEVHGARGGWEQDGYRLREVPDPPPAREVLQQLITAERDRRLRFVPFAGRRYDFHLTARVDIAGAGSLAQGAIIAGSQIGDLRWSDPDADFTWTTADNDAVTMDAQTMFAFAQAAARWRADHIYAARALKDADPIPEDYTDDRHWPS